MTQKLNSDIDSPSIIYLIDMIMEDMTTPPFWSGVNLIEKLLSNWNIGKSEYSGRMLMENTKRSSRYPEDTRLELISRFKSAGIKDDTKLSIAILNVYNNSELWVIKLHEDTITNPKETLGLYTSCTIEDEDTPKTLVGAIIIVGDKFFTNDEVKTQVVRHEFTHYYIDYIRQLLPELFNSIHDIEFGSIYEEFVCDTLQFLISPTVDDIQSGCDLFCDYAKKYFKVDRVEQYLRLLENILMPFK